MLFLNNICYFDFLRKNIFFVSSYFLNFSLIVRAIILKIRGNIRRTVRDYRYNIEQIRIHNKKERAIFLTTTKTFGSPLILILTLMNFF